MSSQRLLIVLQRYLPEQAIDHCSDLWHQQKFDLTITRSRRSKLGDYTYSFKTGRHHITVNGDLNPYAFLVTYLHEVAHMHTYLRHGFDVKPHGEEWKAVFQELMVPMLQAQTFPPEMMPALINYFKNPKAASCSDLQLFKALRNEEEADGHIYLSDLAKGAQFRFRGESYIKEQPKRSRSLCLNLSTGKRYLISHAAMIEKI